MNKRISIHVVHRVVHISTALKRGGTEVIHLLNRLHRPHRRSAYTKTQPEYRCIAYLYFHSDKKSFSKTEAPPTAKVGELNEFSLLMQAPSCAGDGNICVTMLFSCTETGHKIRIYQYER